jgi:gluconate 2-dehydrogenase gamma chain
MTRRLPLANTDARQSGDRQAEASARDPKQGMSRRDAVRIIGITPVLAAIGLAACDMERAANKVASLAGRSYTPQFFNDHEWRTVRVLVDYIIPADERSGSATDARSPEFMDLMLADELTSESTREAVREGMAWLDAESTSRNGVPFVDASDEERRAILDDIAWPRRAREGMEQGVEFFTRMRDMTASAFFSSEMGWKDLQYMGHTFVPVWNGCPPEALEKLGVDYDLMNTRVAINDGR